MTSKLTNSLVAASLLSSVLGTAVAADARPVTLAPIAGAHGVRAGAAATFTQITSPNGAYPYGFALAADGKTMAANFGGSIYGWTAAGGFTALGDGDPNNPTIGISSTGTYVVSTRVGSDGNSSAQRWDAVSGWVDLGHPTGGCPEGGNWSDGYGVSADGSKVVGLAWDCTYRAEGFDWTQKTGMVSLGRPANRSSRASAISADGSTIVGFYEDPNGGFRRAIRWKAGSEFRREFIAGIHNPGEASAVSSDGSMVVGQATLPKAPYGAAFFYDVHRGIVSLGTLTKGSFDQSYANGVSDNGIVIGWSGGFSDGTNAFIWSTKSHKAGMLSLAAYLTRRGAQIPAGVYLTNALAISADGSTVVGLWQDASFHGGGFIATL